MYNDVIELGKSVIKTDDYGNQSKAFEFREVFADVRSVSQSEYYTAAQSGLKPSFKMVIKDKNYHTDEERCKQLKAIEPLVDKRYKAGFISKEKYDRFKKQLSEWE